MKMCTKCRDNKPVSEFPTKTKGGPPKSVCKKCVNEYMREYYKRHPEKKARIRMYAMKDVDFGGIDPIPLLGNPCPICGGVADTIDHCHERMVYRGVICRDCNLMLGHAKDSVDTLRSAIAYLDNHS